MENWDIIAGTAIVTGAFVALGISTFAQFTKMNRDTYNGTERDTDVKTFRAFVIKAFS